jgi:hypothetical protein
MSQGTLAFDAAFALATGALYVYVGLLVRSRATPEADARLANRMFAVWWFGLAATNVLSAARNLLVAAGIETLDVHVALSFAGVVPLVLLLWGLTYYLAFIYTGRQRLFVPITIFYAVLLAAFAYLLWWLQPRGVDVDKWSVGLQNAREGQIGGPLIAGILFSILGPILLLSVGYATLYFRTDDKTARYRIALVSGAFILLFGSALLRATVPALKDWVDWPVASRVIGLVSTLMVLAAYKPPRPLRERMGIREIHETPDQPRSLSARRLKPALLLGVRRETPLPRPSNA